MQKFWTKDNPLYSSIVFIVCLLTGRQDCNNRNDNVTSSTDNANLTQAVSDYDVYWNVPTFQCHKYGLNFSRISTVWGCKQNYNDEFKGEQISIFYDPGEFPALLEAPPTGTVPRNGGVPQEGSLDVHLEHFEKHVESLLPQTFDGLGVLDFEHWRPIWDQNWGGLNVYRTYSRSLERRKHPFWFNYMIEVEASNRYEMMAEAFLLSTLKKAKSLRPAASWGYYGYPFCFNYTPNNYRETCSHQVQEDNNNIAWLFDEMTAYYPSLYLREKELTPYQRKRFVRGRLAETTRLVEARIKNGSTRPPLIFPYIWFKYHDTRNFMTPEDMLHVLTAPYQAGAKGVVIWGASRDVNSKEKCEALAEYVENVLGPGILQAKAGTVRRRRQPRVHPNVPDIETNVKNHRTISTYCTDWTDDFDKRYLVEKSMSSSMLKSSVRCLIHRGRRIVKSSSSSSSNTKATALTSPLIFLKKSNTESKM